MHPVVRYVLVATALGVILFLALGGDGGVIVVGADGRWAFSFNTDGHADGFTFMTRDGGCVRFALDLDAGPLPKRVFVGRGEVQPRSGHFIVCPPGKAPPG